MSTLFLADAGVQAVGQFIGGIVAGGIGGLLPLIAGCVKRRYVLAVIAFLVCVGCGMIMGLLLSGSVGLLLAVTISNLPRRRRHRY